jgi:hypothetical protein
MKKLFLSGILFELLLYFVLLDNNVAFITLNIGKIILIPCFFIYFLLNYNLILKPNINGIKWYIIFVFVVFISSILNIFIYSVDKIPLRSFFEVLIYIYNIFLFFLIPRELFKMDNSFIKFFKLVLLIILFFGFLDIITTYLGFDLLTRHLFDITNVGPRFHSFLGEPRDAFVVLSSLLFFISYYNYKSFFTNYKYYVFALLTAIILTQSLSGVLGIIIGIILFIFYTTKIKILYKYIFPISLVLLILFIGINFSVGETENRFSMYLDGLDELYILLKQGDISPLFKGQVASILPVYLQYQNLINLNLFPLLFGYGIGMSSFYSSEFLNLNEVTNPASQIVRILFEFGFLGIFLFHKIIKEFYNKLELKNNPIYLQLTFFIFIGTNLSHRSNSLLIIFLLCVLTLNYSKKAINNEN